MVLLEGMPYTRAFITGGHVLHEGMSYRTRVDMSYGRTCAMGRHVVKQCKFYWRIFLIGKHVLLDHMSYRWAMV